jgi:hypothetical protein
MKKLLHYCTLLLAASTVLAVTGCAQLGKDPRDAVWDPKPGHSLLDVLPNWDREAVIRCGHHLPPERRRPGMTDRC